MPLSTRQRLRARLTADLLGRLELAADLRAFRLAEETAAIIISQLHAANASGLAL